MTLNCTFAGLAGSQQTVGEYKPGKVPDRHGPEPDPALTG